ncbi:phosphoribosyltransferase family protein [Actinokineospora terrae]|uniref:Adenine phosphoribosyltransferase n=1 Tax=Actinokineospora terrae TaxID=155974 RepID=A0A1H9MX55_9PSEU|nr:phosphoribosyltransferase family protein [Actinokineospora terrae]SER27985.1 adenine phosphoribosyltransferase [Actinokineospora terrae]
MSGIDGRALREVLREQFAWRGDRSDDMPSADPTGWWREPSTLGQLGPALAALFVGERPTVVLGVEARGFLLGPLVALALGVGFVEVRKDRGQLTDSDAWVSRTAPPDYRDRQLLLGFPRRLVRSGDRALLVDDWVDTGGQALGVRRLVEAVGAEWVGVASVVDALIDSSLRRRLVVRSLLFERDL